MKSKKPAGTLVFAGITFRGTAKKHLQPSNSGLKLVFPVNAELIILANKNEQFREILSRHTCTFDGFWPHLIARIKTRTRIEKISGSEFVHDVFEIASEQRLKVFFLGSKAEINSQARQAVARRYNIEIEGYSPEFHQSLSDPQTTEAILAEIRRAQPQILLVALGAPKQEFWLDQHQQTLQAAGVQFAMAVGGTLDMLAGVYRKAPKLVRSAGLEGVWRVLLDPKRIKRFPNPIRFIRIIWHS